MPAKADDPESDPSFYMEIILRHIDIYVKDVAYVGPLSKQRMVRLSVGASRIISPAKIRKERPMKRGMIAVVARVKIELGEDGRSIKSEIVAYCTLPLLSRI